jgi:membrane fusion protein (multidrug efflux system)
MMHRSSGAAWMKALSLIVAAGCGRGDAATSQAQRPGGGPRGGGTRESVVSVTPVVLGSIARSVTVSGVVEPIRTVAVNSQLSGQLLSVDVEEGTRVRAGDQLAELDGRELSSQLAAAEAAYQVAQAAFERAERLHERQIITLPEYERERTAHAAARAQLEQLRTRMSYTQILAPVAGVVTEKRVEAGDAVGTQTRLFALADVSTLVVRVGVSELDVVELSVGDDVRAELDAFPGRAVGGRIRRIFPTADPTTRLVPVEVALEGGSSAFVRPGFLARTTFQLSERKDVLLVPASALVGGSGSEAVFVVDDGRAMRRTVETGLTSSGRVEILGGLSEGEPVITAGNNQLRDGAEVRVVDDELRADSAGRPGGTT